MWLTDGQTDRQTDKRHTIIRPKFYFGRIKIKSKALIEHHVKFSFLWTFIATKKNEKPSGSIAAWENSSIGLIESDKTIFVFVCNYHSLNIVFILFMWFDIWKWSSAHALGASVVWHHSLLLINSFNKTEAAVFSCRLCFLRAFPFISLIFLKRKRLLAKGTLRVNIHWIT